MLRISLLLFFILFGLSVASQDNSTNSLRLHGYGGGGFLIPHRPSMAHLPEEVTTPFEVGISSQLRGKSISGKKEKLWHHHYNHPEVGVSLLHTGTGNKEVLGIGLGLYGFLKLPLISQSKYRLNFSLGSGLGYITKKHDRLDNYKNEAVGSHMNVIIKIGLYNQFVFDPFHFYVGLDFLHFSNASYATPNLGLNLPGFALGVAYELKAKMDDDIPDNISTKTPKTIKEAYRLDIYGAFSAKENYPAAGQKYAIASTMVNYRSPISHRSYFMGGFDLMYNSAQLDIFNERNISHKNWQALQVGIDVGYGQKFNKCVLFIQTGVYIYDFGKLQTPIYSSYGALIELGERLSGLIAVKSHLAKADYLEVGLGYKLKQKMR